jgi:hypothetical protein
MRRKPGQEQATIHPLILRCTGFRINADAPHITFAEIEQCQYIVTLVVEAETWLASRCSHLAGEGYG